MREPSYLALGEGQSPGDYYLHTAGIKYWGVSGEDGLLR